MPRIPLKRRTFGHFQKTKSAANRLKGLAEAQGWDELEVEEVNMAGTIRYKLTGIPFFTVLRELHGTKPNTNAPRIVNSKRRKGQNFRFGP